MSHPSGTNDNAFPRLNIIDTANGGPAMRSSYRDADGMAPGGSTWLDAEMLNGMIQLAATYTYTVTEIAGGSHQTNPASPHYSGKVFDVNRINGVPVNSSNPYWQNFKNAAIALGANQVLGPGDAGHSTHVHVGWRDLPAPNLTYPANGALNVPTLPTFRWDAVTSGDSAAYLNAGGLPTGASAGYVIAVTTNSAALPTSPTDSTCSACTNKPAGTTSHTPSSALSAGITYYWKVRGKGPGSVYGNWSCTYSFTTQPANTRIISLSGNLTFGNVTVGSSAQSTLTIANNGNSTLTVSNISYPSGFSGNWSSGTISAGGSRNVTVTFSPSAATNYGGTVTVNSDKTSGVNTIAASGTGTITPTRIISLSGNLAFGDVTVGSSAQRTLTIANNGNSTMTVSSISYPSGFSGNWSGTISAGGSRNVTVTFAPTAATSYGGTVTVNSDKTSGVNTIAASGTGIPAPTRIISLSGSLAFGDVLVGSSGQRTLTIANNGNSTLTVSNISYPSGFSGNWSSGTISAGGSRNVTVTFSPSAATSYGGTVTVNSDKTSGVNTIAASGTGTITPTRIISLSGNLAFGNVAVGSSAQRTLTIANNGNSTMAVSSISYPSGFSGNWSSGTIPAGGSQNVTVTFSPSAATSYGGTVTVNSDKTSGVNTIAASGTGTITPTRIISLSGNLAFGDVTVGSSTQRTLSIANNGNSTMTVSSISYPGGFSGNWSSGTIPAGGSQTVTVAFLPIAAVSYGGTVTVNSDKTSGANTIAASGTGIPIIIRQLTSMTMSNGVFRFVLNGAVGDRYVVESSSNLVNWLPLVTNVIPAGGTVLITNQVIGQPRRFYRAVGGNIMALIPAGSFTMGDTFAEGYSDELPLHSVYVSAFYMDKYEVTQALWDDVYNWATNHGYNFEYGAQGKAASHPAHYVTWYDAVKWCNARSEKEGRTPAYYTSAAQTTVYRSGQTDVQNDWVNWNAGYRLPTEAEWEKAARGGASGHRFPWSDTDTITHSRANYDSTNYYSYDTSSTRGYHPTFNNGGLPYTSPVGSFTANGYGLYDMAGNVLEWCWDWYGAYSSNLQTDPRGPASSSLRVFRGGSWRDLAISCRAAYRVGDYPVDRNYLIGFRSVLPAGQ